MEMNNNKNEEFDEDREDEESFLYDHETEVNETVPDEQVEEQEESLEKNDYEIFDNLKPTDELWKNKDFRKKIQALGPDIFKNPKLAAKVEPFKLEWAFGFNRDARVINLCHGDKKIILFNAVQYGVLYNVQEKNMQFLKGHPNKVVTVSASKDGRFLATADSGPDNIIIIWQSSDVSPLIIFFDPYDGKNIMNCKINPNGNFLVSVGEKDDDFIKVDVRVWAEGKDEPDGQIVMDRGYGKVRKIAFNPNDESHFSVVFERAAAFFYWNEKTRVLSEAEVPLVKYRGKMGCMNDITYIERCHEAMATTSEGCVIIFGNALFYREFEEGESVKKIDTVVKICKIAKVSINTIDSGDGVVITGDNRGVVNIFDKRLRLIYWYTNYLDTPVMMVRFNMKPKKYVVATSQNELTNTDEEESMSSSEEGNYQDDSDKYEIIYEHMLRRDASLLGMQWILRDFIVVQTDTVSYVDFINDIHTVIYERGHDHVGAIAVHEEFTYLVVGYKNGTICLFNYMDNFLHVKHSLPSAVDSEELPATITCMVYSTKSLFLACGRSNGEVWLLDPVLLIPKQEVVVMSDCSIEKIAFSYDNDQLSFCNTRMNVYLMNYEKQSSLWVPMGKIRSHYKPIAELFFLKSDCKFLVSLGMDRYLIKYNNLDIETGYDLQAVLRVRIDQTSVPLTFMEYPSKHIKSPYRYFITGDDQHKYKLVNEDTQMCRFVALGPAYGCYEQTPVKKIRLLPESEEDYLVFMTKKHFGLQKLPITGNPYSFVGCCGHTEELIDFKMSGDGEYVFTMGKDDSTVLRWRTETRGVELMHNLGGLNFEPLYCVIEGGKNGFLFQEMQDLFFYMQILHEGENSTLPRRVSDRLAISELPDLMRACGFYPTEFEIETFIVDIKYRDFDDDNTTKETISFLEFVQLYINHKPVYGYSLPKLEQNFMTCSESVEEPIPGTIKREDFLELMTEEGEPFTLSEMNKCMEVLLGTEGQSEGGFYIFDFIPEAIDYDILIEDMLGIDMNRDNIDAEKTDKDSEGTSLSQ